MSRVNLEFYRMDSLPKHIEDIAKEIADHFKVRRPYIPQFCSLIKTSKRWNLSNLEVKLGQWETFFSRTQGTRGIIDIVKRGFNSCQNDIEIDKLRGAMVEALVIGAHGGSIVLSDRYKYGWGSRVDLLLKGGKVQLIYNCKHHKYPDCSRRSTVDFGYWNGQHGQFFECKAQPAGIGCKEVSYMQNLKSELSNRGISNEIFFVCAEHRDAVKIRLEDFGLSPVYKPWGIEDIQISISA